MPSKQENILQYAVNMTMSIAIKIASEILKTFKLFFIWQFPLRTKSYTLQDKMRVFKINYP